jgi:dipeptidase E
MPKLYLLGGENVFRRSAKEVNERAFSKAEKPLRILVSSWARPSFDKKYLKRRLFVDYLVSLGASSVDFVDYSDSTEIIEEKMAVAKVFYLTGGLPSVLIERLKKKDLDKLMFDFKGVIVGRSAGALALCRKCITTIRSSSRVRVINGLDLAGITLKVHYIPEKDDDVLLRFSLRDRIYAVPKDSAIVWSDGNLNVVGNCYVFDKNEKFKLN